MIVAIPGTVSLAADACVEWIIYCGGMLDVRSSLPPLPEVEFAAVGSPMGAATHHTVDDNMHSLFGDVDDIFVVAA